MKFVIGLAAPLMIANCQDLNFLVMGDWGGTDHEPWTHTAQVNGAISMNMAAGDLGAKFTISLGDNFYYKGVTSVDDSRFQNTFENVYTGEHLTEASGHMFHHVAGNHDHYGNVQAQIDYSSRSGRWNFPSLWYDFTKTAPDGATVHFVMIDTVSIAGNSIQGEIAADGSFTSLLGSELPGPANLSAAESQLQWLQQTLASSTADYVIVSGHYPVHSAGDHGPTSALSPSRFPYMQQNYVSAYLCGHDHSEQYFDMGDGIQYHVMGSANFKSNFDNIGKYSSSQLKFKALPDGGYATISVNKAGMQIRHFDGLGALLYEAPVILPRGQQPPPPPPTAPTPPPAPTPGTACSEAFWPDKDHDLVCGACKVLVDKFSSTYGNCDNYCGWLGRTCTGAWEEVEDTCEEMYSMACSENLDSTDAICECSHDSCDESSWPDKDHDLVCADCKVLVNNFDSIYGNCNNYCQSVGRTCVAAWEENNDDCVEKYGLNCDETLSSSDALCQCSASPSAAVL